MTAPVFKFFGKGYETLRDYGIEILMPYTQFTQLAVDGTPFTNTRAVFADQDGTATITDAYGDSVTGFPLRKGENRIVITAISALTGATKVFGAT